MSIQLALPQRVASLDIETKNTNFSQPEKSKVLVAGVWFYELGGPRIYRSKGYKSFLGHDLSKLETLLKNFEGIIIGHNLLQFDYRVLSAQINLEGIIEKSVDTLVFLTKKNNDAFRGLSLDQLARINLGKSKIELISAPIGKMEQDLQPKEKQNDKGSRIQELWEAGERQTIIDYNKNDCALTKDLWIFMLEHQRILFNPNPTRKGRPASIVMVEEEYSRQLERSMAALYQHDDCQEIFLNEYDLSILTGQTSQMSFSKWRSNIEEKGHAFKSKVEKEYLEINLEGAGLDPDVPVIFHRLSCPVCMHHFLLVSHEDRLLYANERMQCLWCGKIGVLDNFHSGGMTNAFPESFADGEMGWHFDGIRTVKVVLYRCWRRPGIKPDEARKRIRRLRWWNG